MGLYSLKGFPPRGSWLSHSIQARFSVPIWWDFPQADFWTAPNVPRSGVAQTVEVQTFGNKTSETGLAIFGLVKPPAIASSLHSTFIKRRSHLARSMQLKSGPATSSRNCRFLSAFTSLLQDNFHFD